MRRSGSDSNHGPPGLNDSKRSFSFNSFSSGRHSLTPRSSPESLTAFTSRLGNRPRKSSKSGSIDRLPSDMLPGLSDPMDHLMLSPRAPSPATVPPEEILDVTMKTPRIFNIRVLGGAGCGKATLISKFLERAFDQDDQTIDGSAHLPKWDQGDGVVHQLSIQKMGYRDIEQHEGGVFPDGLVIVFSITSKLSFDIATKIRASVLSARGYRLVPVVLVGTKSDLNDKREVTNEESLAVVHEWRCEYIEASGLTGDNVSLVFEALAKTIGRVEKANNKLGHEKQKRMNDRTFTIYKLENHQTAGWLVKRGSNVKSWKKRWFVLSQTSSSFKYYSAPPVAATLLKDLKGIIPLTGASIDADPAIQYKKDNQTFALLCLQTSRPYYIWTETLSLKEHWIQALTKAIKESDHNVSPSPLISHTTPSTPVSNRATTPGSIEPRTRGYSDAMTASVSLSKRDIMRISIDKFNDKPKKGVEFMIASDVIASVPAAIANFLRTTEGIMKSKIGEYLGELDPFNLQVLNSFVDTFDFSNLEFDNALRTFLAKFRLPGEAQKIDRIMECFAARYCSVNPSIFAHPDAAFLLSFSLIMLNTDAHNPSVSNKMSKDEFISNNRGINNGGDLPRQLLETLYDKIKNDPLPLEHERTDIPVGSQQGWLTKKHEVRDVWDRLFFILSASCLYYFKTPLDAAPLGMVPLRNITLSFRQNLVIELYPTTGKLTTLKGNRVKLKEKVALMCENDRDWRRWSLSLQQSVAQAPVYTMTDVRKSGKR